MKYTRLFILTIILFLCIHLTYATSPKREIRSVWLTTAWGIDWPKSTNKTTQQNDLKAIIDKLHAANFNAIFFQVRSFSDAMYNSSYEPWSSALTGTRGKSPGYDPLEFAIDYAHSLGMELHAWVNPYRYSSSSSTYSTDQEKDYAKTNPDWIMHAKNDNYVTILNPGIPAVRQRIADIVYEIVTNYNVDGVMFDDYFYPNPEDGGTNDEEDATLYANNNPNGLSLADWRRDQVNQMVELVYTTINRIKPHIRFGIAPAGVSGTSQAVANKYGVERCTAPAGDWQYDGIYSDPLAWLSNHHIDYISPQIYWQIGHATADYDLICNWWSIVANQFKRHFYSSHTLSSLGSLGDSEFVDQIALNRNYTQNAAPGSVFYSISTGLNSTTFLNHIKTNSFTAKALPPAMDWKNATELAAPTNVQLSGSTLSWSHGTAERFTVYAYTKGISSTVAMADPTNLVKVVYGKTLNVSSVNNYNSENTTFAVCAYDRYGNEYPPGFYNASNLDPSLTVEPTTSFSLTAEQYSTPTAYHDITVTGLELTDAITYTITSDATSLDAITIEEQAGWNDYAGGTLRIKPNTNSAEGTHSGTITIASGTFSENISFTVHITEPIPVLTASPSSVSLSVQQDSELIPSKDITITAKNLTEDITVSTENAAVIIEHLTWDARTGGTLCIKPNIQTAAGTYTAPITLSSTGQTATISTTITITEPPKPGQVEGGTVSISSVWLKTTAAGENYVSYLGTNNNNRSMAYYNDRLYIADNRGFFHVVDAANGQLDVSKEYSSAAEFHRNNIRITDDGQMLVGNTGSGSSVITLYTSHITNGGATKLGTSSISGRSDFFYTYGNWNQSGYLIALSNTGTAVKIPFANGSLGEAETLTTTISAGTAAKAIPADANSFYTNADGQVPTKRSLTDGSLLDSFSGSDKPATVRASGLAVFELAGSTYMITPTDAFGQFDVWNISDGLSTATKLYTQNPQLGSTANGAYTVDFCVHTEGNDAYIYVLAPNNGIAKYQLTFTPTETDPEEPTPELIPDPTPLPFPIPGTTTMSDVIWTIKSSDEGSFIETEGNYNRSMTYYDNMLYIPDYNTGKLYKVNTADGTPSPEVNLGLTGYHRWNVRITDDGQMLGGNTALGSTLTVYTVNKTTGTATGLTPTAQIGGRSDYFYTHGSWKDDGGYLLALSNTTVDEKGSFTKIPFSATGGLGTPEQITHADLPIGSSAKAIPAPDGKSFYATAQGFYPTQHDFTGKKIDEFGDTKPTTNTTSGLGVFALHGHTYMVTPTNRFGAFDLWDITDGLSKATELGTKDPALGENANGAVTVEFCVHTEGNDAYIYVLAPNNGIAKYQLTFTPKYDCVFEGTTNTDWHEASNWVENKVPTGADYVLIKAPCEVGSAAEAKAINIYRGTDQKGKVTILAEGALTVQESIRMVTETDVTATRYLNNASDLVIKADAAGNKGILAYLGAGTPPRATVEIYGTHTKPESTVDTYIPWQYIAMPFTVTNAENKGFAGSWVTYWDEPTGGWEYKKGTDVTLDAWTGYALVQRKPTLYQVQGTLQDNTAQTIPLLVRNTDATDNKHYGANFIGNSWTAPLQIGKFDSNNFTNTSATIYLHYHQREAEGGREAYHTISTTLTNNIEGTPTVIDPLQGFFVFANITDDTKEPAITLDYAQLVSTDTSYERNKLMKPTAADTDDTRLRSLNITVTADDGYYAKVHLFEDAQYTGAFDNGADAHKLRDAQGIPYLAAASADGDMAIVASDNLHGTYLQFEAGSGSLYTFTFADTGDDRFYLVDNFTHTSTEIHADNTYSFTATEDDHYRFYISRKAMDAESSEMQLWAHGEKLYFTNPEGLATEIHVYSLDGRLIDSTITYNMQYTLRVPIRSVYTIQVRNAQGTRTIRHIL